MVDLNIEHPPVNPLLEKWNKKYPPSPKPEFHQVCDVYSCMWCGRCPCGDHWKCPEEDLEVYNKWRAERKAWMGKHPEYLNNIIVELNVPDEVET